MGELGLFKYHQVRQTGITHGALPAVDAASVVTTYCPELVVKGFKIGRKTSGQYQFHCLSGLVESVRLNDGDDLRKVGLIW